MSWDMKKVNSFDFIGNITHCGDRIVENEVGEYIACFGSVRQTYRLWVGKNRRTVKKSECVAVY